MFYIETLVLSEVWQDQW